MNYLRLNELLNLCRDDGSSIVIGLSPGSTVHRVSQCFSDHSLSIRLARSESGSIGCVKGFILEKGSGKSIADAVRPLILTYPPLLTSCTSDFTEHELKNLAKQQNNSSYLHNDHFSQLSQSTQFTTESSQQDVVEENERVLINDAASTLASMAVMFGKVEHSPLTAGKRSTFFSPDE